MGEECPQAAPGSSGGDPEEIRLAVQAFQAGRRREASFRVLFEAYHRAVQRFFVRRLGPGDECLDLTQETFLRIYKGLKGYRGDGPFGAWLYRIAWNVLRRHTGRRSGAEATLVPLEGEDGEPVGVHPGGDPPDGSGEGRALASVLRSEQRRILRRAIARLPPQRRRCIVLWAYHGRTYEEIAVALQLSVGTVKAHLAQARKQLESLVRESEETRSEETRS